jgi:hypothetical protein
MVQTRLLTPTSGATILSRKLPFPAALGQNFERHSEVFTHILTASLRMYRLSDLCGNFSQQINGRSVPTVTDTTHTALANGATSKTRTTTSSLYFRKENVLLRTRAATEGS